MMLSLKQLYLTPDHNLYMVVDGLHRYFIPLMFILFICINAYPTYQLITSIQQQQLLTQQLIMQQQQLQQQKRLYSTLQTRHSLQISHDQRLNDSYRKIQQILQHKQAEIESIQWNHEQQSINLTANHYPAFLFQIVRQLCTENKFYFSELLFTKYQHKQIQLSASLFIQSEEL